ncbi:hypothetical protein NE237_031044 [Protea cynaroides]|uniref:Uncharacterized protein n=1 Tax=Protea cynaroides TaxID=273540 RepID=A0A9Q0JWL7_9MAGN|nr:hypothetical protein NE237_031044 [Protea cynaroides]
MFRLGNWSICLYQDLDQEPGQRKKLETRCLLPATMRTPFEYMQYATSNNIIFLKRRRLKQRIFCRVREKRKMATKAFGVNAFRKFNAERSQKLVEDTLLPLLMHFSAKASVIDLQDVFMRICIGKDIALTQMKLVAAAILFNFHVHVLEGQSETPKWSTSFHLQNASLPWRTRGFRLPAIFVYRSARSEDSVSRDSRSAAPFEESRHFYFLVLD